MLKLDWVDIALHIAGAFGIMTALAILAVAPWTAAGANALTWFFREMWQQWKKEKPLSPLKWSLQKHFEWIAPAVTGVTMVIS